MIAFLSCAQKWRKAMTALAHGWRVASDPRVKAEFLRLAILARRRAAQLIDFTNHHELDGLNGKMERLRAGDWSILAEPVADDKPQAPK